MTIATIILIVLIVLLVLLLAVSCFFFNMTLGATKTRKEDVLKPLGCPNAPIKGNDVQNRFVETRTRIRAEGAEFDRTMEHVEIANRSGLKLYGRYRLRPENTHRWVISVHGYRDDHRFMLPYIMRFYEGGFNVFTQDNRAHGLSDGDHITMGALDRYDVYDWIDCIRRMDPDAQVVVHGVSMGAATVMMLSELDHPAVVGYIEDCGYTSVWDMFKVVMNRDYHLPTFPIVDITNIFCRIRLGFDYKKASALEAIARCRRPMMFIHGEKDDYIPPEMCRKLYDSFNGERDMYIAPDAGHAESMDYDPDEYFRRVFVFTDRLFKVC